MSHTPGPWATSKKNGRVIMAGAIKVATANATECPPHAWDNAMLIAAAPEMLAFIKACERNLDCHKSDSIRQLQFVTRSIHTMAQELIRKIEG